MRKVRASLHSAGKIEHKRTEATTDHDLRSPVPQMARSQMTSPVTLAIDDFSCIKTARFELAPVSVLIGPQGSGKSVTTKLLYFFIDVLARQHASADRGDDISEFKKDTVRLFKAWFPPVAWGTKRFNITFTAGPFTARVLRRTSKQQPTDDVTITFSEFFRTQYESLVDAYGTVRTKEVERSSDLHRSAEGTWRVRERSAEALNKELGPAYIQFQTFVPAGRAFFTSIGRLVAAVDQGGSLDPVTLRFAKLFADLRDYASRGLRFTREGEDVSSRRREVMRELFGGDIKFERESEYVETLDGRRVPFTALSSGQQELLPMWMLIDFYGERVGSVGEKTGELFYIEEPEAHLFPAAQSTLMDFLIGQLVSKRLHRNLILTTHSPYILAKLNNYLKAGALGRVKRRAAEVAEVVPRDCWLTPRRVRAYAMVDGVLTDLVDTDGLIDAHYIDEVSDQVGRTFSALLDIEYPETAG